MRQARKLFTFSSHLLFYCLTWHYAWGLVRADTAQKFAHLAGNCLTLSTIFLVVTYALFVHILRSYGNIFTRLMAIEVLLWGVPLSVVALTGAADRGTQAMAGLELAAWAYFAYRYQGNKARYERRGAGPVPVDTCIKIPVELPRPGDAVGTGGLMANLLHQGVAHTETVVPWKGKLMFFSSWFENGAFLNEIPRILKPDPKYPNYLLQRRPAIRPDQLELMEYVVRAMIAQNQSYVERVKSRRERYPGWLKQFMDKRFPATGYDWLGRYTGRRAPDHWTCNVVYLEVMRRSGIEVVRLGQGAAGLRTGWFDIPNTEDLRGDDALHLVRNKEVPALLAAGQQGAPQPALSSDADLEARVEDLVRASTNIYNIARFEEQGHGCLPRGIMINPPAEMLPPGAILLISGIGNATGDCFGHREIVIADGDKKWALSTCTNYGMVISPLEQALSLQAKRGITVALVPVIPWTEEQCKHSLLQAQVMLRQNKEWVIRTQMRRQKQLASLPLPAVLSRALALALDKALPITGYDWSGRFGLFHGRSKINHWTSIGLVQELLWRMGITLDQNLGQGLPGAGTSKFQCYRDLTEADYQAWLASKSS